MFDIKRKSIEWGGRKLTLETGRIARQADGAVLATYGETMVLATAVFAKSANRLTSAPDLTGVNAWLETGAAAALGTFAFGVDFLPPCWRSWSFC